MERNMSVREITNQILEDVENGIIDPVYALTCALKYMSEDEVRDMAECNELIPMDYEEEDDGQPSWEQEWADFGESYE